MSDSSSPTSPRLEPSETLPSGARAFYRRWVGWTVAGEAAGFMVAAIAGALASTQGLPGAVEFALLVGAGSIEGALLGTGQAIGMSRLQLPSSVLRRWPVVTSAGAALAWSIGLLPSSIPNIPWFTPVTWLIAAVLGSALLLSIPTAQYLLLRSTIPTAGRWIWVNALAWLLGICWTFAPSPLVNASTPIFALILIYAVAGVLMAATVAVITGLCWLSWLRSSTVRLVSWRSGSTFAST
jgi:hypothetical protein